MPRWLNERTLILPVILCALLWGGAFPGIKHIYLDLQQQGIPTGFSHRLLLAGLRFTLAGLLLLLISRQPIQDWKRSPKHLVLLFALFLTVIQYALFYSGLHTSSAVLGSLLASVGSFWWALLAPILTQASWPNLKQWLCLLLGAAGVTFAVYHPGASSGDPKLGALFFLTSTLSGTIAVLLLPRLRPTMGSRCASGYGLFVGGLMLSIAGFPAWGDLGKMITPTTAILTTYLALVSSVAFGIWNYLTTLFPATLLAGYRFIIPVCGVIESTLFVTGETLSSGTLLGGGLVIFSIFAQQRLQDKKP